MRRHPLTWLVPLAVALVLAGVGVALVMAAASADERRQRELASAIGPSFKNSIASRILKGIMPLYGLDVLPPQVWRTLRPGGYEPIAADLWGTVGQGFGVRGLLFEPQGVVAYAYPLDQWNNSAALGTDLFKDSAHRPWADLAVSRANVTMEGPGMAPQGYEALWFRRPVWVRGVDNPAETFGAWPRPAYDCPKCYNATTHSRLWGFVSLVVDMHALLDASDTGTDTTLATLSRLGYAYNLTTPMLDPGGPRRVIAVSDPPPTNPVVSLVSMPVGAFPYWWSLAVSPAGGWAPPWRGPMLAVVAVGAALIGALAAGVLVARRRLIALVGRLQSTNAELCEEKERMDVLLARQLNLITCALGQRGDDADDSSLAAPRDGGGGGGGDSGSDGPERTSGSGSRASREVDTLERIEGMRRALTSAAAAAAAAGGGDELRLMELLGEGAFGRVFRGLWRGTVVAIKVMVLPAAMSGDEKRERMALMEAAISTAMLHPNVVTTYTYTIRAATTTHAGTLDAEDAIGGFSLGVARRRGARTPPPEEGSAEEASQGPSLAAAGPVLSYEVCLVLEYCPLGSLRDALDAGAYLTAEGGPVNYAAVLDTAADVARAMAHLHRLGVIHSDLKARNVLLKQDGPRAVAKVADFGLSVPIQAGATHVSEFRGTISHMAPEAQMERRITRASDVYSFGVLLWELFTGGHAFEGVPLLLLAHRVSVRNERPAFPAGTPPGYLALAEACWHRNAAARPTFEAVLATLTGLRGELGGPTPPLRPYSPGDLRLQQRHVALAARAARAQQSASAEGLSAARHLARPLTVPEADEEEVEAEAAGKGGGDREGTKAHAWMVPGHSGLPSGLAGASTAGGRPGSPSGGPGTSDTWPSSDVPLAPGVPPSLEAPPGPGPASAWGTEEDAEAGMGGPLNGQGRSAFI